jgi:hypothetical protein
MRRLLPSLASIVLVLACVAEPPTSPGFVTLEAAMLGSSDDPGAGLVTIPFKASFYTVETDLVLDGCGPGIAINTQEGTGTGTHLGRLHTKMVFCFDLNPGPTFGSYSFVPGPDNGYFMAANGDQLWISVTDGVVIFDPSLGPKYVAYFQDPFDVMGGTGRFEGATGGGMINSLVGADGQTDHHWTGEITVYRPGL